MNVTEIKKDTFTSPVFIVLCKTSNHFTGWTNVLPVITLAPASFKHTDMNILYEM